MKKHWKVFICSLLAVVLLGGTVIALAAEDNPIIRAGQTREGDVIAGGVSITNDGVILGDFIAGVQTLTNTGEVEGDLIAGASQINVSGKIGGSLRVGAAEARVNCSIERNAMVFGSTVTIGENTVIKRNAYYLGGIVNASGRVLGNTSIHASNVTLGGIYEGDVTINDMNEGTSLKLLPGTIIKGKLTYEGITKFEVPDDVQVGSYSFIKIEPVNNTKNQPSFSLWSFIKKIFTLLVYYLFALLIYKLFPRFFVRSGDFIGAKPLNSAGIGIATLGSLVAGGLALILFFILALFIINGSVAFFGGLVLIFVTVLTIIFADIPVSMWLGSVISNRNLSVPTRLAIGFASISVIKIILDFLSNIQAISSIVGIVSFILNIAIWIFGTGALVRSAYEVCKSANKEAENEEFVMNSFENPEM